MLYYTLGGVRSEDDAKKQTLLLKKAQTQITIYGSDAAHRKFNAILLNEQDHKGTFNQDIGEMIILLRKEMQPASELSPEEILTGFEVGYTGKTTGDYKTAEG